MIKLLKGVVLTSKIKMEDVLLLERLTRKGACELKLGIDRELAETTKPSSMCKCFREQIQSLLDDPIIEWIVITKVKDKWALKIGTIAPLDDTSLLGDNVEELGVFSVVRKQ